MKKEKEKKTKYIASLADSLSSWITLAIVVVMMLTAYPVSDFTKNVVVHFFTLIIDSNSHVTKEYTKRVLSDVHVAVINNVYDIEENLDNPDQLNDIMERMVRLNKRMRSCGISFVKGYYPQKGRWFCPYAWKENDSVMVRNMGDAQHDYLNAEWFKEALQADSDYWSKPFMDGYQSKVPLVAYLHPIHNRQGKTVAVLGADISLEWLTAKLMEQDSEYDDLLSLEGVGNRIIGGVVLKVGKFFNLLSSMQSCVVNREGLFVTHINSSYVLKENLFNHLTAEKEGKVEKLRDRLANSHGDSFEKLKLDGEQSYLYFTPVKHTDWLIVTQVPAWFVDLLSLLFIIALLFFMGMSLPLVLLACRFAVKSTVKPLIQLAAAVDTMGKGNFSTVKLPELKSRDEVHQLRDAFDDMQHSLQQYITELKETTASKAVIENELKIAHDIQMSMLPKTFPPFPERQDIDVYGMVTPAKAVGGDLYDFFIRDNKLFFCIGDVSGKGVPASLVMAVARSIFRNVAMHIEAPEVIVSAVNSAIADGNERNMFVTFFVGVLDLQTRHLNYCNAGHDAPLLLNQGVEVLPCEANLPVGALADWQFIPQAAQLDPQTVIFLYTDGLAEAENSLHELFGEARIKTAISDYLACGNKRPKPLIEAVEQAVRRFVADAEQSDDLTMMAIQCE